MSITTLATALLLHAHPTSLPAAIPWQADVETAKQHIRDGSHTELQRVLQNSPPGAYSGRAGRDMLRLAAKNGNTACLSALLEWGVQDVEHPRDLLSSILHIAAYRDDASSLRVILGGSRDPGRANRVGWNPVHAACIGGAGVETLSHLLDGLTTWDTPDQWGQTPYHLAARFGALSGLMVLAELKAPERRRVLNRPDVKGMTPLHHASIFGQPAAVDALIREGATSWNKQDALGRTPLHWAIRLGRMGIVDRLRISGADPILRDTFGAAPSSMASMSREAFFTPPERDSSAEDLISNLAKNHSPDLVLLIERPVHFTHGADSGGPIEIALWEDGLILFGGDRSPMGTRSLLGSLTTKQITTLRREIGMLGLEQVADMSWSHGPESSLSRLVVSWDGLFVEARYGEVLRPYPAGVAWSSPEQRTLHSVWVTLRRLLVRTAPLNICDTRNLGVDKEIRGLVY